jgi:hypothetical protein
MAGGQDVENTGKAVRQALPFWPSRPKQGTHHSYVERPAMSRRDKTSLSGRLHRFSKGVFKHRAFRLGGIMARGWAGVSIFISDT